MSDLAWGWLSTIGGLALLAIAIAVGCLPPEESEIQRYAGYLVMVVILAGIAGIFFLYEGIKTLTK